MHAPNEARSTTAQVNEASLDAFYGSRVRWAGVNKSRFTSSGISILGLEELMRHPVQALGISPVEVFDLLPLGVQIDNSEHRTIYVNLRFTEMFGYALNEIADIDDWYRRAYPDPTERAAIRADWAGRLALADATGEQIPPVERQVTCKDGSKKAVEFFVRRIGNYYIYLNTDVSERSQLMSEISRFAYTDPLTNLENRRSFFVTAEILFRRPPNTLAGLMIDVDHFKNINDRFGHKVGDDALVHVAGLCREILGKRGHIARLGGEEFGLLLPDHNREATLEFAEKMRTAVASQPYFISELGVDLPITISIGGAVAHCGEGGVDVLMARADRALYDAKHSGRNRVRVAD
jgi:diguanylate cyclase (GGDEF)-like protein